MESSLMNAVYAELLSRRSVLRSRRNLKNGTLHYGRVRAAGWLRENNVHRGQLEDLLRKMCSAK